MQRDRNPSPGITTPGITTEDAQRIIVQGDAELLVARARELALQSEATSTSVRRLYTEALRTAMLWKDKRRGDQARRRAILFRPRLTYLTARDEKLRDVDRACQPMLEATQGDEQRFQRFVEFLEALVAYKREK